MRRAPKKPLESPSSRGVERPLHKGNDRPVAVDLFSGAGGMALGFEQAGFDIACALEIDAAHAAVHRFNFPRCEVIQRDIAEIDGSFLREAVRRGLRAHGRADATGDVDVVFGGPPCQGFSVGGLLDPEDPRNRLVAEFARLVAEIRPRAFVLENVPAMASRSLPGTDMTVPDWLRERLGGEGFEVGDPMILNASHYGVPQDRRRLMIVGVRQPFALPERPRQRFAATPKLPTRPPRPGEVGHTHTRAGLPQGPAVKDALLDLPNLDDFDALLSRDEVVLSDRDRTMMRSASPYAKRLIDPWRDPEDLSWPRRRSPSKLTSSLRTVHAAEVIDRFAATAAGDREPVSRFVRLHPDGVGGTLRAGSTPDRGSFSAPRPIHPRYDRVISVREAARLQGFPDWFRFSAAKWHGFRQVGNSVCPPVARAVAETVRDALELPSIRPMTRLALGRTTLLAVPSGAGRRAVGRRTTVVQT